MRHPHGKWSLLLGAACLFTLSMQIRADEMDIPLDQVPKAVSDAAKAKFPGAIWRGAAKETEDGKTTYELMLTYQDHKMDVSFEANGTLVVVETELREADVPAVVAKAVKDKYPGAKVELIESVKKGPELKKEADYFEFHLMTADKKEVEVEVDSQGKILE